MFQFGLINSIDSTNSLLGLIIVVAFILFFQFATGLLEYSLHGQHLYNEMLQRIYKELMQMGLINFIIVMYQASPNATTSMLLEGIDFAHILLFYVAIYFVVYCLFLIAVSITTSKGYQRKRSEIVGHLIACVDQLSMFKYFLFRFEFLPMSRLARKMEFKVIEIQFRDIYPRLPTDFDFALYMNKCFKRYVLRTVDMGILNWTLVVILGLANFMRVQLRGVFNCHGGAGYRQEFSHRMLAESSSSSSYHKTFRSDSTECHMKTVSLFWRVGLFLFIFMFVLFALARLYELRLVRRVGLRHSGDYARFLEFALNYGMEVVVHFAAAGLFVLRFIQRKDELPMTVPELKKLIIDTMDSNEIDEEGENYEFIHSLMQRVWRSSSELLISIWRRLQLFWAILDDDRVSHSEAHIFESRRNLASDQSQEEPIAVDHAKQKAAAERAQRHGTLKKTLRGSARNLLDTRPPSHHSEQTSVRDAGLEPDTDRRVVKFAEPEEKEEPSSAKVVAVSDEGDVDAEDTNSRPSSIQMFSQGLLASGRGATAASTVEDFEDEAVAGHNDQLDRVSEVEVEDEEDNHEDHPPNIANVGGKLFDAERRKKMSVKALTHYKTFLGTAMAAQSRKSNTRVDDYQESYQDSSQQDEPSTITYLYRNHIKENHPEQTSSSSFFCSIASLFVSRVKPTEEGVLPEDINDIFLFGKPKIFYRVVEASILLSCVYLAVWSTNIISFIEEERNGLVQLEIAVYDPLIMPIVLSLPLLAYIAKVVTILSAFSDLNLELIKEVLEEMEEKDELLQALRSSLLKKIGKRKGPCEQTIHRMFHEINPAARGYLGQLDFRNMLRLLKLRYSDERFRQAFLAIDTDGDGKISELELYHLLYANTQSPFSSSKSHV